MCRKWNDVSVRWKWNEPLHVQFIDVVIIFNTLQTIYYLCFVCSLSRSIQISPRISEIFTWSQKRELCTAIGRYVNTDVVLPRFYFTACSSLHLFQKWLSVRDLKSGIWNLRLKFFFIIFSRLVQQLNIWIFRDFLWLSNAWAVDYCLGFQISDYDRQRVYIFSSSRSSMNTENWM